MAEYAVTAVNPSTRNFSAVYVERGWEDCHGSSFEMTGDGGDVAVDEGGGGGG